MGSAPNNDLCAKSLRSSIALDFLSKFCWLQTKSFLISCTVKYGAKYLFFVSSPHWPDFHWNVSKSWLQRMDFFEIHAILAIQSDNANFYVCQIIKVTSGFDLKKKNFHQVAPLSKKQLKYFSNTNNSTTLTLSGSPGVSREAKLSTEFEFGSLVC